MTRSMMAVIIGRPGYDPFSLCSASMKKLPIVTTCSPGFSPSSTCVNSSPCTPSRDLPGGVSAARLLNVHDVFCRRFR